MEQILFRFRGHTVPFPLLALNLTVYSAFSEINVKFLINQSPGKDLSHRLPINSIVFLMRYERIVTFYQRNLDIFYQMLLAAVILSCISFIVTLRFQRYIYIYMYIYILTPGSSKMQASILSFQLHFSTHGLPLNMAQSQTSCIIL